MNLLVALSTGVAYVASVVMMVVDIRSDPTRERKDSDTKTYFDSCVFLTFFILAGKALEARAKLKACTFHTFRIVTDLPADRRRHRDVG